MEGAFAVNPQDLKPTATDWLITIVGLLVLAAICL